MEQINGRGIRRGLRSSALTTALWLVIGLIACGEDETNPQEPPVTPVDDVATFSFDSSPGGEFNPSFTEGGVTIALKTDATVNAAGVVQFVDDERSNPYRGDGNLRLSKQSAGPPYDVAVTLTFSVDIYVIDLYAYQADELVPDPVTTPFTFEAISASGNDLGTFGTTRFTPHDLPVYEALHFESNTGVRRLRLVGVTNVSYFDEMTISTVR